MEISLPDWAIAVVNQQISEGGFETPGAYIAALIRADAEAQLRKAVGDGLESKHRELTPEVLAEIRSKAAARLANPDPRDLEVHERLKALFKAAGREGQEQESLG